MMTQQNYTIHSDFADELAASSSKDEAYSHTVRTHGAVTIHHIRVHRYPNELDREVGDYISVAFSSLQDYSGRMETANALCGVLSDLMKPYQPLEKILVIGLGNRFITSDALGPGVTKELLVTAHLYQEGRRELLAGTRNVAVLAPGVMGQTGLESSAIIKSVADYYKPDLILAIDALATRSLKRINRVVQVNNTGIQPGSGVGNPRRQLNEAVCGVPVIALGVATVTSVGAILQEALDDPQLCDSLLQGMEQTQLDLVVTPKAMDDELRQLIQTLSSAINQALHPGYANL